MTYFELISRLLGSAAEELNINYCGYGDIYKLNSIPAIEYSVFYITPNTFNVEEDTITYSLNLYYIDRWDETDNNQLEIQSSGILALQNIINRFNTDYVNVEISYPLVFTPFYQRFKDICAGVFVRINVRVDNIIGECVNYE